MTNKGYQITKWEQSNNLYVGHLNDGEDPTFELLPYHPEHKSLFKISANIYITNIETDFILDIDIVSITQFDIGPVIPTVETLYEVYCFAREVWNQAIVEESIRRDIFIDRRGRVPIALTLLKPFLEQVIQRTYSPN